MASICPSRELYIQFGSWVNDTHVYIVWLNRPQNRRIFALYDLSSPQSATFHPVRQTLERSTAWIEVSNVSGCICLDANTTTEPCKWICCHNISTYVHTVALYIVVCIRIYLWMRVVYI